MPKIVKMPRVTKKVLTDLTDTSIDESECLSKKENVPDKVITLTANDKTIQLVPFSTNPKKMTITVEF